MRRGGSGVMLVVGVCFAAAVAASQDPPQVFRATSDLVVLHVNVFDGKSDAVPDLPQSAFQVFEDGKPQTITFFSSEDVPVAVGLVMDNSGSMITRRAMTVAGAKAFSGSSHPQDQVFTIIFNEHIRFGLPPTVKFSTNPVLVQSTFTLYPPGGKTAVHDAVIAGIEHLEEASHQKRVLVLLSDGEDNASRHSEDDMLQRAVGSNVLIYTVSTADLGTSVGNNRLLRRLAERSGGVSYSPKTEKDVVEAFAEIATNIRRGYSVGYVPTNTLQDGRYRKVKITVRAPGRRNLDVAARDGYLAPRNTSTN